MRPTHSNSSRRRSASLFFSCPVFSQSLLPVEPNWNAQSKGAHWCSSWRSAMQGTEQGGDEIWRDKRQLNSMGLPSFNHLLCRRSINPTTRTTSKKHWNEKSWWQVFSPYPETTSHNQWTQWWVFRLTQKNLCLNATIVIHIFWSRNPISRKLP